MKKLIKAFICNVLTLSIVISLLCGTAYAGTSKSSQAKQISITEYADAMGKIYAQYGMEWKIVDSSNATSITKELFDSEIARATKECKEYQAANSKPKKLEITKVANQGAVINSFMPSHTVLTSSYQVTYGVFCVCNLSATAYITYNADNGNIIYLDSWALGMTSAVNLDEWVDEGSYVYKGDTFCKANYKGTCYFSYTIPVINVKVSQTVPVLASLVMK